MQYAIVILDGASGEPVPEFGGRTSLEVSKTPHIDTLAQSGTVGLVQNVPEHLESSSDVACLSIVGYDPAQYRIGRGAIEGAALGIELQPGQVALRLNLCSVEHGVMRSYSTDNIATEDSHALARELKAALDDDIFTLHLGVSFRHILVVNGHPELMDLVYEAPHDNTDKDIMRAYIPRAPKVIQSDSEKAKDETESEIVAGSEIVTKIETEGAAETAMGTVVGSMAQNLTGFEAVSEKDLSQSEKSELQAASDLLKDYLDRAREILAQSEINTRRVAEGKLPANFAWAFWPGMKPGSLKSFTDTYNKTAALNSAVDLLDGIALLTEMKSYTFEGITDDMTNDFAAQGAGALTMLEDGNDVVIVHVEAPDTAGHDGRPDEKQTSIERIDSDIVRPLLKYAEKHPLRIAAMPDHPTPLATRKHSHDPVPFVISGPGIAHNGKHRLTEKEAQASGVVVDPGHTFLEDVLLKA